MVRVSWFWHWLHHLTPSLKNASGQLILTLITPSFYQSVRKQLIQIICEAHSECFLHLPHIDFFLNKNKIKNKNKWPVFKTGVNEYFSLDLTRKYFHTFYYFFKKLF
jgi:hypothetical protein